MNSIAQAVPEAALQAIRKLIKEQGFGPGDALPSQRDLAVQIKGETDKFAKLVKDAKVTID